MRRRYPELTFTPSVKEAQRRYGSRRAGEMMENFEGDDAHLTGREADFIAERDGFYLATVNESGWPYVQFRGGPRGFLKVLDATTLGYVDFGGNRQYISTGNLAADDRAALFLMDYAGRRRLKILARTEVAEAADRPELVERLRDPDYRAKIERVVLFRVEAFDWNCPQHITPRFTEDEISGREEELRQRIRVLERRLEALSGNS